MIVMGRQNYFQQSRQCNRTTHLQIHPTDPTNKYMTKLISILNRTKQESGLDDKTYKYMYPVDICSPTFYGLPKIHKKDTPTKTHIFYQGFCSLWNSQGHSRHAQTPGRQIAARYMQYTTFHGTNKWTLH